MSATCIFLRSILIFKDFSISAAISFEVTENGTYTITAIMQDGSGRKGEKTVVISDEVTNPYEENGWEVAWTCTNGVWSDKIEKGTTIGEDIDIVGKLYKTGNTVEEKIAQDIEDTNDGKLLEQYSFDIIVTGTQVEPVS